jgi:hypothetical protein
MSYGSKRSAVLSILSLRPRALRCLAVATASFLATAAQGSTFALISPAQAASLTQRANPTAVEALLSDARSKSARPTHARAVVHTAGLLPGEGDRTASLEAQEDWRQTQLQALAFRLSEDPRHLAAARRYIDAWLDIYHPSYSPIDETALSAFFIGFDLVQDKLSAQTIERMRAFAGELTHGYLAQRPARGDPSTERNNWQSHRIKLATAGAYLSGDARLIEQARQAFRKHLGINLRPDGTTYDFEQRDALHYVVYTLEPMLVAALMGQAHGEDWYAMKGVNGAELKLSIQWLAPYARGERTHEEFVNTTVAFDRRRAALQVPGFAGPWQRDEAGTLFWLACRLDPQFASTRASLKPPPPWIQILLDPPPARAGHDR